MPTLQIDLQTGFQDDSVEVAIDEDTVYQEDNVTTSPMLGIADEFAVEVKEGTHQIDIQLPSRRIISSTNITVEHTKYLGVSVEGGEVVFYISDEGFGYM